MKTQTGARWLRKEKAALETNEEPCLSHVKRESVLKRLESGAVKRVK